MRIYRFIRTIYILLLSVLLSGCNNAAIKNIEPFFTSKVISVKDGDTIEVLYEGKPIRVRLAHIDCPEIRSGQPYGKAAKQLTSQLCFGQNVKVITEGEFDSYGRLIAVVMNADGQNINKELVSAGMAWHYTRYSNDASYTDLEKEARNKHVGIWQDEDAVAPWEWRNNSDKD